MSQSIRCSRYARALHLLLIIFLATTLALVAPPRLAYAATRIVNKSNCSETTGVPAYCTIQTAINAAIAGDTISIASGSYTERISVDKDLFLIGSKRNAPIIDGRQLFGGLVVDIGLNRNATITGITIRNGNANNSVGGIVNRGILTVSNSTISGNRGGIGGIANQGTLTISNSIISGNTGSTSGGIL